MVVIVVSCRVMASNGSAMELPGHPSTSLVPQVELGTAVVVIAGIPALRVPGVALPASETGNLIGGIGSWEDHGCLSCWFLNKPQHIATK